MGTQDDLRKILHENGRMASVQNGVQTLSKVHERYRQADDDRRVCDGIPERNVVTFG